MCTIQNLLTMLACETGLDTRIFTIFKPIREHLKQINYNIFHIIRVVEDISYRVVSNINM